MVIELKSRKDLPIFSQGLDYWERVREHLLRGDFEWTGYFPGTQLSSDAPRLYLLAPLFEFHPDLGTFAGMSEGAGVRSNAWESTPTGNAGSRS